MEISSQTRGLELSPERFRWLDAARQLAIVVAVYIIYSAARALSGDSASVAVAQGEALVRWQRDWGLYWEPDIQSWTTASLAATHIANTIYFWFHLPLLAVFAIWMFFRDRERFRFLRSVWVITQVIGAVFYFLYPVAPPRLLPAGYGFEDTMAQLSPINYSSAEAGPLMNQYAAFPSLHFAWSVIIAVGLYQTLPWPPARLLALLFPLASFWSIVATGNHFVADALGGAAVVALAFLLASALDWLLARPPPSLTLPSAPRSRSRSRSPARRSSRPPPSSSGPPRSPPPAGSRR
jgi:hypothetical protein